MCYSSPRAALPFPNLKHIWRATTIGLRFALIMVVFLSGASTNGEKTQKSYPVNDLFNFAADREFDDQLQDCFAG